MGIDFRHSKISWNCSSRRWIDNRKRQWISKGSGCAHSNLCRIFKITRNKSLKFITLCVISPYKVWVTLCEIRSSTNVFWDRLVFTAYCFNLKLLSQQCFCCRMSDFNFTCLRQDKILQQLLVNFWLFVKHQISSWNRWRQKKRKTMLGCTKVLC